MPLFDTPRTRRLKRDYEELLSLKDQSTILDFTTEGDPPEIYHLTFHGRGLDPKKTFRDVHQVDLNFGLDYPRQSPSISWKTPISHPNISGPNVCLGNFTMSPYVRLSELVEILWDMARMAAFNPHSAYHGEGNFWYGEMKKVGGFPVDLRILRDKAPPPPEEPGEPELIIMGAAQGAESARPSYGAGLLIMRPSDGKVLLTRRSDLVSLPGRWAPPGGSENPGETPDETAYREAAEELGPLPALDPVRDEGYWRAKGPYYAFATFGALIRQGQEDWKPTLNPENDEWGWFDVENLPRPMLPGAVGAVRAVAEMIWRWKPPHMGIATTKTFSVCKAVNVNQGSPFFLSAAITILDETTGRAFVFSIPFEGSHPGFIFLPVCVRTTFDKIWDRYQALLQTDPNLTLTCTNSLTWEDVPGVVFAEMREKGDSEVIKSLESTLTPQLELCLG